MRLGYQGQLGNQITVGAAYSPKIDMGRFDDYRGLFAGSGDFDIPENLNLGVAWQARPDLTLAADWQRIEYGSVKSVGNPLSVLFAGGGWNARGLDSIGFAVALMVLWGVALIGLLLLPFRERAG